MFLYLLYSFTTCVPALEADLFRKQCVFNNIKLSTNFTSDKNSWVEWKETKC